jgi:hypothetical protein
VGRPHATKERVGGLVELVAEVVSYEWYRDDTRIRCPPRRGARRPCVEKADVSHAEESASLVPWKEERMREHQIEI